MRQMLTIWKRDAILTPVSMVAFDLLQILTVFECRRAHTACTYDLAEVQLTRMWVFIVIIMIISVWNLNSYATSRSKSKFSQIVLGCLGAYGVLGHIFDCLHYIHLSIPCCDLYSRLCWLLFGMLHWLLLGIFSSLHIKRVFRVLEM